MDFAGFEVLGRVAEGSTGVVWQARQVALGRLVAIKELAASLVAAPGFLERFRAEARVLGGLDDPHVVRLYDYVEEPQRAYLVQEWVDGAPLSAVLDRHGRLSAEQSLGVIRGGLLGLAHAHQRGLVHRDVSMANILLDAAGVSKLVDFGLAAPSGSADGLGGSSVGTPAFSSPEAVLGQPMTPRSDVYSAAAVLFALLTARAPYVGDLPTVLQAHVTAPTPALPGFAPRLTNLLWRAMAKRPEDRPADAAAFLAELEEAAREAYGAAWLGRASVAGLATAGAVATGSVAAFGGAAAQTAAQAVSYGAATTPAILAGQQIPAAAAGIGARAIRIPRVALMIASAIVVVIAIAATVVALVVSRGDSEPLSAAPQSTRIAALSTSSPAAPTTASGTAEPEATSPGEAQSASYEGTLISFRTEEGFRIGIACAEGRCNLTGYGFGGGPLVLTRDGAVFTGGVLPRSASCDDIQAGIDVVITTQGESMTLVGTPTGPVTVDCGGGVTQTDEFQPVAFTGTLVDGSPPQTWP